MTALEDDGHCFVCGPKNSGGLRLVWDTQGRRTETVFTPQKIHQGWKGVVHGGLLAAVLDEAMTRLVWQNVGPAVTVEMTVRYLLPAKVGEPLRVVGEMDEPRRITAARSWIEAPGGAVVARAEGKTMKMKEDALP